MSEIWKDIPGFEGLYQVSNLGRVKSLPRGKQWPYRRTHNNIRKPRVKNGYYQVNLSKENKVKWLSVHRLVALAFIPNPDNLPCINHRDENRLNNSIENLEWCSYAYNANYGTARQRQIESMKRNDPLNIRAQKSLETRARNNMPNARRKVVQMDSSGCVMRVFNSIADAGRQGYDRASITYCCQGKRKTTGGYKWKYYEVQ